MPGTGMSGQGRGGEGPERLLPVVLDLTFLRRFDAAAGESAFKHQA
jgi:hypothetical protein